jgi:hypothetical protein
MRARSTAWLTTTIAFVALATAGCSDKDPDAPPGPASQPPSAVTTSATPNADTAVIAARDEVLNRYRGYNTAYVEAQQAADAQNEELLSYLESPLKQRVIAFLTQTKQHGAVYRGTPQSNPSISKIDLKAKTPTAVVSDCYDATKFLLYYTKNNQPVPIKSGPRRYIIETTAAKYDQRGWLFTKAKSFPERSC